ncbi:MAG: two-component regulator propeller domain-containing protein [Robiginitalea sp.]|uniref:ligand-binding sensor domain-containing protein n=1 Tax=Robiginitalea sp. TaxID=1902411 RepID=UPI003C753970
MKLKKIHLTIWMLFSILTPFSACTSQGNRSSVQTPLKQESNISNKTELDSEAAVIYQDKKDNLWFVDKKKGVYRYDGENLTLFTSNDGLGSYRIISVQEDNFGNLYFDTPEGVYKYDREKFTTLLVVDMNESENEWKSEPGDLWFRIGWDKRGPYRFDGKNLYHLKFPKNKMEDEFYRKYPNSSVNPYAIYSIYEDSKGNVWFGTSNLGIYLFDGKEISWMYENHLIETPEGGNFGVRSIAEDQDGNYWICNANYRYSLLPYETGADRNGLKSINYMRKIGIENIANESLYFYSMETDKNGDLLMFAGDYGLWRNNGKELSPFFIKDGEQNISPTTMYKDKQGTLWFGTDEHGIYSYNGNTFEKFKTK